MPTVTIELFPAKQAVKHGRANITVTNHSPQPETLTTRTVLLKSGCKTESVTGVKVPAKITLAADQSKTVHVQTGNVTGDIGVIFSPAVTMRGMSEAGGVGAQVVSTGSVSCVPPKPATAAEVSRISPVGMTVLLIVAAFIVVCLALAYALRSRLPGRHTTR